MDYQAVLRRKKDEEQRYRAINDIADFDEASARGYQGTWKSGGSYPLRRSRSAELEESSRVGPTPPSFLTPSPHMLVPGAGQRSSRFNQDSGPGHYLPSFGENSQKRNVQLEDHSMDGDPGGSLPWERTAARIESIAGGASKGTLASVQGSGQQTCFQPQESVMASKQGTSQQEYRQQLQKQIEEQRRQKEMRKAREREEEEKLERRAEEQRLRIQKEIEEEAAMRKFREQQLQQKQDFLVKKQQEFAAAAAIERQNAQKRHSDNNNTVNQQEFGSSNSAEHRGWTPAPVAKITKSAEQNLPTSELANVKSMPKEIGHRGWTPAPVVPATSVRRTWTPPTLQDLQSDVQNQTEGRSRNQSSQDVQKELGHRGWTPTPLQPQKVQQDLEHRGWTPQAGQSNRILSSHDLIPLQEVQDKVQKESVHRGFTYTTGPESRSSVPNAVPDQIRETSKVVNLSSSVLDEIAQLRERLRSEHRRQDQLLQRYYRVLSHQFFDD